MMNSKAFLVCLRKAEDSDEVTRLLAKLGVKKKPKIPKGDNDAEAFLGVPAMALVNPIAAAAEAAAIAAGDPEWHKRKAQSVQKQRQVNHLTPKAAGGCPIGDGNLAANDSLCAGCLDIEEQLTTWQSQRTLKP